MVERTLSYLFVFFLPLVVVIQGSSHGDEGDYGNVSCPGTRPRRYDVTDFGNPKYFQGWADVTGQGAAHDYCRIVSPGPGMMFLSCALAGTAGESEYNYNSVGEGGEWFDEGFPNTWYMKDEDGDGRDDFCRCVGIGSNTRVACMKAGEKGFYGSAAQGGDQKTFTAPNSPTDCRDRTVHPLFGSPN
ncbi:Hypp4916 [Branchiostoma lanceolatum]|uniref:Hypp4916 protein n=1 Tax=Branchiostoma lanceolatum TaxID=7740 RepID=A0A8K0AB61_BRALA|nr:Hypp4916 [Branchiostoma lanceolatum]